MNANDNEEQLRNDKKGKNQKGKSEGNDNDKEVKENKVN